MTVLVDKRAGGFLPLLDLEALDGDAFLTSTPTCASDDLPRGLLGAQGVVAAGQTVDTDWRWVQSLDVTHLEDGNGRRPVVFHVERLCDSDDLSTRLVRGTQDNALLASMTVSFQVPRSRRAPTPAPIVANDWPDPHALPAAGASAALDIRHVDRAPWRPAPGPVPANRIWLRFTEEIPDRILLHAAAIVHAAELLLGEPLVGPERDGRAAPARHLSVRIHAGFRADDWVRLEHDVPIAANHRVPTTGRFYSSMGRLVASVSQETALVPASAVDDTTIVGNGSAGGSRKE